MICKEEKEIINKIINTVNLDNIKGYSICLTKSQNHITSFSYHFMYTTDVGIINPIYVGVSWRYIDNLYLSKKNNVKYLIDIDFEQKEVYKYYLDCVEIYSENIVPVFVAEVLDWQEISLVELKKYKLLTEETKQLIVENF